MKILVVSFDCAAPELLLGEERLSNIRRLMSAGCFGRLESVELPSDSMPGPTICAEIDRNGGRSILLDGPIDIKELTRSNFAKASELLGQDDWTYFQLNETGLDHIQDDVSCDYYQNLDDELGTLLGLIDDDTAVLVYSSRGAFVLAVPGQSARGEIEGAGLLDLAPTLLDLAGCPIPASMPGRSLVHAEATHLPAQSEWFDFVDPSVEERLRGLGYLG
jgi:predicted AlkP superfamily phosphohydrolase/phosphomutase